VPVGGITAADLARWKANPVAFIEEVLRDPETGHPFVLYPAQRRFLKLALTPTKDGRLPFVELLFAASKKSGKTATSAMVMLTVIVVLAGPYGEGYCVANDLEQASSRVFQACARIIAASPLLASSAKVSATRIEFEATRSTITALASDYASAAGANPSVVCFDELWAYTSERSRRLWDEMVGGVPTRKVSVRLTTTYAGFANESTLLEDLYKKGLRGKRVAPDLYKQKGLLMYWTHRPPAPWQTRAWVEQMRSTLRTNAFLRLIENRFVTSEQGFVEAEWWNACERDDVRPVADKALVAFAGLDASVRRDATAVVCCTWDDTEKRVRVVWHRVWQPTAKESLNFEATVKRALVELRDRFDLREVLFDPYQMQAVSQRLVQAGIPMVEFAQTVPNLTEASTNLYELVKAGNLAVYRDEQLRKSVMSAVAVETPRGMKLSKRSASEKIDACVALSMAAAATKGGPGAGSFYCAAANLSPTATRITLNSSADDEAAGYAAEQRRWELEARGREFGADDGPDFVGVYGSGRRFEPF
jgi:phage terminase large subunit-like protein